LARRLGVSRTPLREALIKLEKQGFLVSRPNVGYSVRALSRSEVVELYPLVWTLEELALEEAFPLARTYIPALQALNAEFKKTLKSPAKARQYDMLFHQELLRGCRNTTLFATLEAFKLRLLRYESRYMEEADLAKTSSLQHEKILDALQRNDKKEARAALVENWQFGMHALLARIGADTADT
jgi:DNA-binding GntR family transcriptional regulator